MISALQSYLFYVYNPHHPAQHSMACGMPSSWACIILVPSPTTNILRWQPSGTFSYCPGHVGACGKMAQNRGIICVFNLVRTLSSRTYTFTGQSFKKKVKSCEIRAPIMLSRYYRHAHLPEAPWIVLRRYSRPQRRTTDDRKQFDKLDLEANLVSKHCRACCSHWVLSAVKFSGKRFPPTKRYGKPGVLDGATGFCKATRVRAG